MSSHRISITVGAAFGRGTLGVECSCRTRPLATDLPRTSLEHLNQIAHEHIEAAESYGGQPCPRPGHKHPMSG